MESGEAKQQKQTERKGGRPVKAVKRNHVLVVRLTALERLLIEGKAKEAGMSSSAWFRRAAKWAKVTARLSPEDLRSLRILSGMANNLNQITHLAHKEGLLSVLRKCREILSSISETMNYFREDDRKSDDG